MTENNNVREGYDFRLDELFWSVLRRWRGLIIVMIIVGILLGSYGAVHEYRQYHDPVARETAQNKYDEKLEQYTRAKDAAEAKIENLKDWMARQDYYEESSLMLLMDPYNVYKATLTYFVDSAYEIMPEMSYQNPNYTKTLLDSYSAAIGRLPTEDLIDLDDGKDLTAKHMVSSYTKQKDICSVETDPDNSLLTVTVICDTNERGAALTKAIKNEMNSSEKLLNQVVGEHKLSLIGETAEHTVDMDILNLQTKFASEYESNVKELTKAEKDLSELKEPARETHSKTTVIKQAIKYGVIGVILGLIVSALLLALIDLIRKRFISTYELQRRFGIPVLSVIDTAGDRRTKLDFRIASKLGFKGLDNPVSSAEYASSSIRHMLGDRRDLIVVGTAGKETSAKAIDLMNKTLSDLNVRIVGDICSSAEAVNGLVEGVPVVCLEPLKDLSYTDIEKELGILNVSDNRCLGFIAIS